MKAKNTIFFLFHLEYIWQKGVHCITGYTQLYNCRLVEFFLCYVLHYFTNRFYYLKFQGPSRETVHRFWQLVWQERLTVIVDLEENKVSEYKKIK